MTGLESWTAIGSIRRSRRMYKEVTRESTVWGLMAQGDYEGKRDVGVQCCRREGGYKKRVRMMKGEGGEGRKRGKNGMQTGEVGGVGGYCGREERREKGHRGR